jgi:hypothetical protein
MMSLDNEYLYERIKEYLDDERLGELVPDEDTFDPDYGWIDLYEETHQDKEESTESYDLTIDYLNFLYYQL